MLDEMSILRREFIFYQRIVALDEFNFPLDQRIHF